VHSTRLSRQGEKKSYVSCRARSQEVTRVCLSFTSVVCLTRQGTVRKKSHVLELLRPFPRERVFYVRVVQLLPPPSLSPLSTPMPSSHSLFLSGFLLVRSRGRPGLALVSDAPASPSFVLARFRSHRRVSTLPLYPFADLGHLFRVRFSAELSWRSTDCFSLGSFPSDGISTRSERTQSKGSREEVGVHSLKRQACVPTMNSCVCLAVEETVNEVAYKPTIQFGRYQGRVNWRKP
jgi:hypothetical protein